MEVSDKIGMCIRTQGREVLFQNECSLKVCGNLVGTVCNRACKGLLDQLSEGPVAEGMKVFKNVDVDGQKVDAMVVNDGTNLVTFIYPLDQSEDKIKRQEEFFKQRGLTPSESRIMTMVLAGMTNAAIAESLFISKATLKTHLNNAYKKLPSSMRPSQIR